MIQQLVKFVQLLHANSVSGSLQAVACFIQRFVVKRSTYCSVLCFVTDAALLLQCLMLAYALLVADKLTCNTTTFVFVCARTRQQHLMRCTHYCQRITVYTLHLISAMILQLENVILTTTSHMRSSKRTSISLRAECGNATSFDLMHASTNIWSKLGTSKL
jgi:hypothetical protein